MKDFLALLPEASKPDYLAVHIYTTTFEDFKTRIENYWTIFQLPIFLTEFAMQVNKAYFPWSQRLVKSLIKKAYRVSTQTSRLQVHSNKFMISWVGPCIYDSY